MTHLLASLSILVTRPNPGGAILSAQLNQLGAKTIALPTLIMGPPPNAAAFLASMARFKDQDWVIFISPQAVFASQSAIPNPLPEPVKLAAIGPGTAQALQNAGLERVVFPPSLWTSEGLLALPDFQAIRHQQVMIIKGLGGRDYLETTMQALGAEVLTVIAYQRLLPSIDISPYLRLMQDQRIDVIVCGSWESVSNLKILCGDLGWPVLKKIPVVVVSERIKKLAEDLGFQTVWVAQNTSIDSIVEVLVKKRKVIWQMKLPCKIKRH